MSLQLFQAFEAETLPPTVVPLPPELATPYSGFAAFVAQTDLTARALLGGEPVIYTPHTGSPVTVTGIFDRSFVLDKGTADAGVEAVMPAVFLQLADLPIDPEDDDPILTIRGSRFRVTERRDADFGSIVLALRELAS